MSRKFWNALIFTSEGHLDFSWLLTIVLCATGVSGFIIEACGLHLSVAAWTWLGASFSAVLIAAVPISKARILAKANLPGDIAKGMGQIEDHFVPNEWTNGDPQEGIM